MAETGTGRVVGIGDRDVFRPCRHGFFQCLQVQREALFKAEVYIMQFCADGPGSLQVGGVVGADDNQFITLPEQRSSNDEKPGGGANSEQDIFSCECTVLYHKVPQPFMARM